MGQFPATLRESLRPAFAEMLIDLWLFRKDFDEKRDSHFTRKRLSNSKDGFGHGFLGKRERSFDKAPSEGSQEE